MEFPHDVVRDGVFSMRRVLGGGKLVIGCGKRWNVEMAVAMRCLFVLSLVGVL